MIYPPSLDISVVYCRELYHVPSLVSLNLYHFLIKLFN